MLCAVACAVLVSFSAGAYTNYQSVTVIAHNTGSRDGYHTQVAYSQNGTSADGGLTMTPSLPMVALGNSVSMTTSLYLDDPHPYLICQMWTNYAQAGATYYGKVAKPTSAGQTVDIYVNVYGAAPCGDVITGITLQNTEPIVRYYNVLTNGNYAQILYAIAPGQSHTWSWTFPSCCSAVTTTAERMMIMGDGVDAQYTGSSATNNPSQVPPTLAGPSAQPGVQYSGGTSNIQWGTNTQMSGDSAIYDNLSKGFQQNHKDLTDLKTAVNGIGGGGGGSVSNYVSVNVSNSMNLDSMSNLLTIANEQRGFLTNLLGQAKATGEVHMARSIWNEGTNGQAAYDHGVLDAAHVGDNASLNAIKDMASAMGGNVSDPGDPGAYTIHLGLAAYSVPDFTVDPLNGSGLSGQFRNFGPMVKAMWTWILYAAYVYWIVIYFRDNWKTILKYRGTQIQNLTVTAAGFGGNILGVTLAGLVNVAVLCDMDLRQCFYKAYKVIEPRKGYMNKNGQFVKES